MAHVASSHFGSGILTFHTGYLFRTPEGWNMWAMGLPNRIKDGIQALAGLVQTDWLPYPFTMNWKFSRPGRASFEKGEPFCFLTLIRPQVVERITPKLHDIKDNPALKAEFEQWKAARTEFNTLMAAGDADAIRQAWQRYYMRGIRPDGSEAGVAHANRRRLNDPEQA
jgi:ABC-type glycerol-3-phosphate transport system substrate-binding protein